MLKRLAAPLVRYARWLHLRWPAGEVEKLPKIGEDGRTNLPGVYITGDLTGIPLLKLSLDSGVRAVRAIDEDAEFREGRDPETLDLLIVGAGVSGMAAALEARERGLRFRVYEAKRRFQTIADFPKAKPIYTYPKEMQPPGELQVEADVKEDLLAELERQTADVEVHEGSVETLARRDGKIVARLRGGEEVSALRAIVAIGRSGRFRKLDVPGEESEHVFNRLHDPADFAERRTVVIGGGDGAVETALALDDAGSDVALVHRRDELSRPKPENVSRLEASGVDVRLSSRVTEIRADEVALDSEETLPADAVFAMIGREAPLGFFRRAGVKLRNETRGFEWVLVALFFVAVFLLFDWKGEGYFTGLGRDTAFPGDVPQRLASVGEWWAAQVNDRSTLLGTLAVSMKSRSFYYTLAYTLAVGVFGVLRIRRRRTPYVTVQTATLFFVQFLPLFLLPEVILPWMGYNGWFDGGWLGGLADSLFEKYIPASDYLAGNWPEWGHPRAYWRAYGLILAWPLMVYNVFTPEPIAGWLAISVLQTFVLIPLLVWRWGKGAYCGWICSCGGLAETVGDTLRDRMPHGPGWNRLNLVGQGLLVAAFALLAIRVGGWLWPESWMASSFGLLLDGSALSWKWTVDVLMAGVLGVGLYLKYSGRVWCRFACPLAALMHVYARFTRFRIFADKKKCISCNVCTSICHQGIDVMNFANKGLPMQDPQCVRCSACVQACPTGVLSFGRAGRDGSLLALDRLPASNVQRREG